LESSGFGRKLETIIPQTLAGFSMKPTSEQQQYLRQLPGVDQLLEWTRDDLDLGDVPRTVQVDAARATVNALRQRILENEAGVPAEVLDKPSLCRRMKAFVSAAMRPNLVRVVNATGVVVHTNLGRSRLADEALDNIDAIARHYSNLEFDLAAGRRGSRYQAVADILCEISGAEGGLVVNNNAGAVLIALETLARGKDVIVSRGELVEIGGAFRIPDVMAKSGARLKEVGTTNRTHLRDYADAIDDNTGLLLKVHKSNYAVVGFTKEVSLTELVELGRKRGIPVMEDLGSGTFVDFSHYGLAKEPTVQESVAAGVNVITFSGDKLLGGPQGGLIVGQETYLERIRKNPINRAMRIDKMTLAALESTLRLYRDPRRAVTAIPTLRMLTAPLGILQSRAQALHEALAGLKDPRLSLQFKDSVSRAGGGALPLMELPTRCVAVEIQSVTADALERMLRRQNPPVIGRIENDAFLMDPRTLEDSELPIIQSAFNLILGAL
jgi:L-seryl-tRNA(Ser) seleniumtransferase